MRSFGGAESLFGAVAAPYGCCVNEVDLPALLGRHAVRHSVPGAAVGVLRRGVASIACYGAADAATGEPVTPGTRFSAGSLTKSMVATVIARLAAGRLSLDDLVAVHVPELRGSSWAQRATLRDLLANRSGLPLRAGLEFGFADRADRDGGALSRLVADAAAGGRASGFWSYSNVGWCVLGRAIETAAGTCWEEAMRRYLLDEAGMSQTAFVTAGSPERRARGHEVTADGPVPVAPLTARAYGPAGTTAVTTVTDLLRFAGLHLQDPALAALRAVHADVRICGWLDSWCLGWAWFGWQDGQVWGWDGLIDGERSVLRIMAGKQAAAVLLTNASTGRAMYRSLFTELMPPLCGISVPPLRLDPSPGAAGDLSRFAGVYGWPDRQVDVTATADGLLISSRDGQTEAFALDKRTFLTDPADPDNPTVTFGAFDAAGQPAVLYDMLWGLPRLHD
jgi:CubicO group peptidase (beta-lactamase class C family)